MQVTNTVQIRIEEDLARLARGQAQDKSGALSAQAIEAAINRSGLDGSIDPEHWEGQRAAIYAMGQGGRLTLLTGVAGARARQRCCSRLWTPGKPTPAMP